MKNSADQGGWYSPKPKAVADNTLLGLQNSSYLTKAKFNNCFIANEPAERRREAGEAAAL